MTNFKTTLENSSHGAPHEKHSEHAELHDNYGVGTFLHRIETARKIAAQRQAKKDDIKCKNVWVWKSASLSCLSGMTLKSVMHITK